MSDPGKVPMTQVPGMSYGAWRVARELVEFLEAVWFPWDSVSYFAPDTKILWFAPVTKIQKEVIQVDCKGWLTTRTTDEDMKNFREIRQKLRSDYGNAIYVDIDDKPGDPNANIIARSRATKTVAAPDCSCVVSAFGLVYSVSCPTPSHKEKAR